MTKSNTQTKEQFYDQEIRKYGHKLNRSRQLLENTEREYIKVEVYCKECLAEAKRDIDNAVRRKAIAFDNLKNLKLERDRVLKKLKPIPKPKVKLENGKIKCQYCGKEFSPQGITTHEKACKKKAERAKLMAKLKALDKEELVPIDKLEVEAQLVELQKEKLIPIEIPEVKEIPTIEEKLEVITEVKEIVNQKKAELEAKLEEKLEGD